MSESLSPNNSTPKNSQSYEANQNIEKPLKSNYNDEENIQNQIENNQNKTNIEKKSINNEISIQDNNIKEPKNTNIVDEQEKKTIDSSPNLTDNNFNISVEPSQTSLIPNQISSPDSPENSNNNQNSQEQLQSQNSESNSQEEQTLAIQKPLINVDDQIHPINTPIEEIYGVDRNFRGELVFTVRFAGYNKTERMTNQDMKKYHQQELIAFYEKCMTFGQVIDMPPYKPR